MSTDADAFRVICEELELHSALGRLESRGTVRLVVKKAGLDPRFITAAEMLVVLQQVMPQELEARGVQDSQVTPHLLGALSSVGEEAKSVPTSPADIFRGLGRDE